MQVFTCKVSKSNSKTCKVFLLYSIANWSYCKCKAFLLDTIKHTIILYYYSIFFHVIRGHSLHFRTSSRKSGKAYLFNPQTPCKISISETFHLKLTPKHHFDTEFDKTSILRHFYPFSSH